jgi:chromosome segregation ATPase
MLSKDESAFQILQNLIECDDPSLQEELKDLTQSLVSVFTEFTGTENENEFDNYDGFSPSPFKQAGAIQGQNVNDFSQGLLDKMDKNEKELIDVKSQLKEKNSKIIDLEAENTKLRDQLKQKNSDFERLNLENEDFKKRAKIELLDCLELELNQKKQQVKDLSSRLEEKQKEYNRKLQNYQDQYEEYRVRIRDLEEYRVKYEEMLSQQSKESSGPSDEKLREEYEK